MEPGCRRLIHEDAIEHLLGCLVEHGLSIDALLQMHHLRSQRINQPVVPPNLAMNHHRDAVFLPDLEMFLEKLRVK